MTAANAGETRYSDVMPSIRGNKWFVQVRIYRPDDPTGRGAFKSGRIMEAKPSEVAEYRRAKEAKKQPKIPPRVRKAASEWLENVKAEEERRAEEEREAARRAAQEAESAETGETVGEFMDRYLAGKALHTEASTLQGYRALVNNQIKPLIGSVPVAEFDAARAEEWQREVNDRWSESTARKAFFFLKGALGLAVAREELDKNTMGTLRPVKKSEPRKNALTPEGRAKVAAFVDVDPTDPYSLAARLALMCGLRQEEACALQWRDIDFGARTMRIDKVVGRKQKGARFNGEPFPGYDSLYIKRPKNDKSRRTVALPESVLEALRARKARMMEECTATQGCAFSGALFVLGRIDGRGLGTHEVWRRWNTTAAALNLLGVLGKPPTFHDLRHTYATAALRAGIDVNTVASQMGHSNVAMTLNTYASADPDAARRAADIMDGAIRPQATGEVVPFKAAGGE